MNASKASKALVLLLLVSLLGRLALAFIPDLTCDEAYSYYVARLPLADIVRAVVGDRHPPLYYMLLHAWLALGNLVFGGTPAGASLVGSELFLRLPGVVASLFTIAGVYRLVRSLGGEARVALLAAALASALFSSWHYDIQVRMYGLSQCCVVWGTVLLARLALPPASTKQNAKRGESEEGEGEAGGIDGGRGTQSQGLSYREGGLPQEPGLGVVAGCALLLAAGVHLFYFAAAFVVAAGLALVAVRCRQRAAWLALGGASVLCLPLLALLRLQLGAGNVEAFDPGMLWLHLGLLLPYFLGVVPWFQQLSHTYVGGNLLILWAGLTVLGLFGVARLWPRGDQASAQGGRFLAALVLGYLGLVLLATAGFRVFNLRERYFYPAYPYFAVALTCALAQAAPQVRKRLHLAGWLVVVANLALAMYTLVDSYLWDYHVQPLARALRQQQRPGDVLVLYLTHTEYCLFAYYYDRDHFDLVRYGEAIAVLEPSDARHPQAARYRAAGGCRQLLVRSVARVQADLKTLAPQGQVFLLLDKVPTAEHHEQREVAAQLTPCYDVVPGRSLETTTASGVYGQQTRALLCLQARTR